MECNKCHLIYQEEDTRKFSCNHIICNFCFCNIIIKELINSIDEIDKIYSINCKCNKGTLSFKLDEIKNIKIPSKSEEIRSCSIHLNQFYTYYDKTLKKLLCDKCIENEEFKSHENIKISDLKTNIKEKLSDIDNKTYEDFKQNINTYLAQFINKCNDYYKNEIEKIELLIEKIKKFESILQNQMETQIEKEKILFELIDKIYENNYKNLKILNEEDINNNTKYGYYFYKQLSKIKFNFGEFGTEYQEEIIPEIENITNEFEKNVFNKKFKVNIKYPYFELIKRFTQINDIKQESIITCLAENRNENELFVGYRDYSINVFVPKNTNYEISQTLKFHKGEINSLLYIDNYLISSDKNKKIFIWSKDNDNIYKVQQIINSEKEIKKINKYINGTNIGFLTAGDESNFRLFLKNNDEEINKNDENSMKEEEEDKDKNNQKLKEIFKIEQVLSDHDNEVTEAIQIKSNTDIISGSKDSTIMIWKDFKNSLQYECAQIISAGNELEALCQFGNKGFAFAINSTYEIKIYELNYNKNLYENVASLNQDYCHDRMINQIILLKDNRLASCSYDSTVKIMSYNSLSKELREDQELNEQNLSVNSIVETKNGKLISGGHGKHLIIYKRN